MFGWFTSKAAPACSELYDTIEDGDKGVVEKLLKNATAEDINWIGKVSRVFFCGSLKSKRRSLQF